MKVGDIYQIRWEDADGCPQGWVHVTDLHPHPSVSIIESIGWVEYIDNRCVRISPHVATNAGHRQAVQGYVTIPKSGILFKRRIK